MLMEGWVKFLVPWVLHEKGVADILQIMAVNGDQDSHVKKNT